MVHTINSIGEQLSESLAEQTGYGGERRPIKLDVKTDELIERVFDAIEVMHPNQVLDKDQVMAVCNGACELFGINLAVEQGGCKWLTLC